MILVLKSNLDFDFILLKSELSWIRFRLSWCKHFYSVDGIDSEIGIVELVVLKAHSLVPFFL